MEGITIEKVICANSIYSNTINGSTNVTGSTPGPAGNPAVFNKNTLSIFSNFGVSLSNFGTNWVQTSAPQKYWKSVSLSASGQYQTAITNNYPGEYIYISNDFGNTWIQKSEDVLGASLQKEWKSISLSASGQYQIAIYEKRQGGGSDAFLPTYMYISTDFGNTWTQSQNASEKTWTYVSLSASGQHQTAVTQNDYIYVSSDFGNTWSQSQNAPQKKWNSVSLSSSGQYQTAAAKNYPGDYIYISTDFGNTWTENTNAPKKTWYYVSLCASGQYQTAVAFNDYIYISTDFGITWTSKESEKSGGSLQKFWFSLSLSASGQYQTAVATGDYIYVSSDFGNTWTKSQNAPQKNWQSVSLSASGQYQTAVATFFGGEYIYTCISS